MSIKCPALKYTNNHEKYEALNCLPQQPFIIKTSYIFKIQVKFFIQFKQTQIFLSHLQVSNICGNIKDLHNIIFQEMTSTGKEVFFGETVYAHQDVMAEIWGPAANIAILLVYCSHNKWLVWLHGLYFFFVALFTLSTSIPMLRKTGIIARNYKTFYFDPVILNAHYCVGIAALITISFVTLLGIMTKLLNILQAKSSTILLIRKIHMVSGYIILGLCKSNYYIIVRGWALIALIVQDAVFLLIFVFWKQLFPRMEAKQIAPKQEKIPKKIKSLQELETGSNYAIFANYVFSLEPLKINHPAGYQIVNAVRNKDVDRYIYGSCTAQELPQMPIWSHSYKSFNLLDEPVAKLDIPPTFEGFDTQEVQCNIPDVNLISEKGSIYQMFLTKKVGSPFRFQRYTHISQLGRCYSLTLNDNVTRLYTLANFLVPQNKDFLEKWLQVNPAQAESLPKYYIINGLQPSSNTSQQIIQNELIEIEIISSSNSKPLIQNSCIPIMFKRYPGGKFTDQIVNGPIHKLILSQQKGLGLELAQTKPGKIIIVAGGTGLYPFSDLIDLLYKDQLMRESPQSKYQILSLNPILSNNPFSSFTFELLAAFHHLQDIHIFTLKQLLFLADRGVMNLTFKFSQDPGKIIKQTRNITLTKQLFEDILETHLVSGVAIAKIMICGPPRMNEAVSKSLKIKCSQPGLYLIV